MTKPCYDVGYGKPPLHTRFRKGQSGNPKGRSKGTRTQLANDAARGDKKSIQLTFAWLQTLEPRIEAQKTKEVLIYSGVLAEDDRKV
jgi:hypothetical protein